MKTTIPRQALFDALTAISALVGARTPKPILGCVRLVVEGEEMRLSATDGEAGLHLGIPTLTTQKKGQCVVPADRLLGIIREMPDVEVVLEADDRQCTIRGVGSVFHIFVMPVSDFPPIAGFEGEPDLIISGHELRRMITLTVYAAAKETSRFAINGVLWEKQGKKLFLVATDGRRLARAGGPVTRSSSADFEAIVPAKVLSVFEKVFVPTRGEDDWQIEIKIAPNQMVLRSGSRVLSTILVEGHFPKYQDVIPTGGDKRARVNRDELFRAVKRAALLTTEESRAVKLSFEASRLTITSQAPEQGDAQVELAMEYSGAPIQIGFNPAFVNDALGRVPFEDVFIELQESFRPGTLSGEDKSEFLYVVMPVSLSS